MKEDSTDSPYVNPYGAPQAEIAPRVGTLDGEFPPRPWLTILVQPRATIQRIVESDPRRHLFSIMLLAGIVQGLHNVAGTQLGTVTDSLQTAVPLSVLIGILGSFIGLAVGPILLSWTGRLIGGRGTTRNTRAAVAWASVPGIWSVFLFLAKFAIFGTKAFAMAPDTTASHLLASWWLIELGKFVVAVWALIIFLKCLGQVQGFSAWIALVNLILAGLLIFVPLVAMAFVTVMILVW